MKKKKNHPIFKKILLLLLVFFSCFFILCSVEEITQIYMNEVELKSQSSKSIQLNKTKKILNSKIEQLSNPEYVLRYARGKYLVTKEGGEQVFKLQD